MKNVFSKDIFKLSLKKLGLISSLTGLISIMVTSIRIISGFSFEFLISYIGFSRNYNSLSSSGYTAIGIAPMLIIVMFLGSVFFTYTVFKYQNKRASADKHHSLPYTRTQQYVSRIMAVLTMLFIIIILTMVFAALSLKVIQSEFIFRYIILGALGYMAGSTLIVGITAAAMSFTGNIFANLTVTAILLFLPRSILFIMDTIIMKISAQLVNPSTLNVLLNPSANIPVGIVLDATSLWEYNGMSETLITGTNIVYTFVLGIIYIFAALFISNKRKSELAEKSFINSRLSYIFASLCTMPVLILAGYQYMREYMFTHEFFMSIGFAYILLIIFAFVLYFIVAILYTAKIKGVMKGVIFLLIAGIVSLASMGLGCFIGNTLLNKSISSDKVDYITVNLNQEKEYINSPVYTYGVLKAKSVKIYDEKIIEETIKYLDIAIDNIQSIPNNHYPIQQRLSYWCEFRMKSGQTITRHIPIYNNSNSAEFIKMLMNDKDYYAALSSLPDYSTISRGYLYNLPWNCTETAYQVYNTMVAEIQNNNITERRLLPNYVSRVVRDEDISTGQVGGLVVSGRLKTGSYKTLYDIDNTIPRTKIYYMQTVFDYYDSEFKDAMDIIINKPPSNYELRFYITIEDNDEINEREYKQLLYSTNGDNQSIPEDYLITLCEYLNSANSDDFDIYENFAEITMHLIYGGVRYNFTTFIPLSNEAYEHYTQIIENQ